MGGFINVALMLLILQAATTTAKIIEESDSSLFPLTGETYPESYEIELRINPEDKSLFVGQAKIKIHAVQETKYIALHANKTLRIKNISVSDKSNDDIVRSYRRVTSDTGFIYIKLKKRLVAEDEYNINIKYTGEYFNDDYEGLLHKSYEGNKKFIVWSDFDNRGVRRIFPGYDEKGYPATVSMTIIHPEKYRAVFVAPIKSSENQGNGMVRSTFLKTEKMPISSLSLVVFDMDEITNSESLLYPTPISVFSSKNHIKGSELVLNYLEKSLVVAEEYFDYKLNFPKINLVIIPETEKYYGGYEGLFIMGSDVVMYNSENKTEDIIWVPKSMAYSVVSLFAADQISLNIWDKQAANLYRSFIEKFKSFKTLNLPNKVAVWKNTDWLDDGLTDFLENHFADLILDLGQKFDDLFVNTLQDELNGDDSDDATILGELFIKAKSYYDRDDKREKGASIHRMIYHTIGEKQFKKAIRSFVKKYKGKLIDAEDYYHELDMAVEDMKDINMTVVMDSWIKNKGFPVVITSIGNESTEFELSQKRYTNGADDKYPYKWWIPISWTSKSNIDFENTRPKAWLKPDSTLQLKLKDKSDWFIINVQQTGYYRVNYHQDNWMNLAKALKEENFGGIHVLNRAQLINDAYELSNDFNLDFNITAEILSYLEAETEYVPWVSARSPFEDIIEQLQTTEKYKLIEKFLIKMLSKVNADLGFHRKEDDTVFRRMHREMIANLMCLANDDKYIEQAGKEIQKIISDEDYKVDIDTRSSVYCCGIQNSTEATWDEIFTRLMNEEDESMRDIIIKGLACSDNLDIIKKYLKRAIDDKFKFTDYDRVKIVENCLKFKETMTMDFLLDNFEALQKITKKKYGVVIINDIANEIKLKESRKKFKLLNEKYEHILSDDEKQAMTRGLKFNKINMEWIESKLESFEPWIDNYMITN